MTYTDDFRQRACLTLKKAGYPTKRGALRKTAKLLNVPRHTLARWFHELPTPDLANIALPSMINHELQKLFASLDRQRDQANYAQLSNALTQLVDTMHQLDSRG